MRWRNDVKFLKYTKRYLKFNYFSLTHLHCPSLDCQLFNEDLGKPSLHNMSSNPNSGVAHHSPGLTAAELS